jgi:hypothetical protein
MKDDALAQAARLCVSDGSGLSATAGFPDLLHCGNIPPLGFFFGFRSLTVALLFVLLALAPFLVAVVFFIGLFQFVSCSAKRRSVSTLHLAHLSGPS